MYKIRRTEKFDDIILLNNIIFPQDSLEIDEKSKGWLVYHQSIPIAFCTMRMLSNSIAFMDRGGILSEYRGKGLHRRLIKVRENYAKKLGFKTIITYVMKDNYSSLFTLIRHDYKMYEPEYNYAGQNVIYLQKKL